MCEYTADDILIPVVAELLPDGSVKIHETILRGSQSTFLAMFEVDDECYIDKNYLLGTLHVDEWCTYHKHLYLIAAEVKRSSVTDEE